MTQSSLKNTKSVWLKEKIKVVHGDMLNWAFLETALTDVHTVFIMTASSLDPEVKYNIMKMIADIVVKKDVKYIIFSTLPFIHELSDGKYIKVTFFDAKVKAEWYIWGLSIKSAFCLLELFMENF